MRGFLYTGALLGFLGGLWGCSPPRPDTVYSQNFDQEGCSSSNSDIINVDDLEEVSVKNASEYILSGGCSRNNTELQVFLEGHPVDQDPVCNRGKWRLSVDITGIVSQKENFQVAVSQGGRGGRVCVRVKNHFVCPEGYIGVPQWDGFTSQSFCIMKYEAKHGPGSEDRGRDVIQAQARANGKPITGVTIQQARQFCRENGGIAYDLMSNKEWQSVARAIEVVDDNWSEGIARVNHNNFLNTGNTSDTVLSESRQDDEDEPFSPDKRTHRLINGAYIWDFAGNLWEMVQHNINDMPEKYFGYIYKLPTNLENLFGPEKNYSTLSNWAIKRDFGGLGYANLSTFRGVIIRGGGRSEREAGVFSVDSSLSQTRLLSRRDVGFRCSYHP